MTCQVMLSLGPYVLGAADAGERRLVEGHLAGCGVCRDELLRLAPLPGLLARLPAGSVPAGAAPDGRSGQPAPAGRGARAWRSRAAAGVAAAAAGLAGGFWLAPHAASPRPATPAVTFSGVNSATRIRGRHGSHGHVGCLERRAVQRARQRGVETVRHHQVVSAAGSLVTMTPAASAAGSGASPRTSQRPR
jgi:hypothetical protein